jgi:hypothetical protein
MKLRFNKRKWWHFGKSYHKSISIEIAGPDTTPAFYLLVDGCEREVQISFWFLFVQVWITFDGFFSEKWFPKEWNSYANDRKGGYLHTASREFGIHFHGYAIWWCLWRDHDVWNSKDWRHSSWHPFRNIKGRHSVEWKVIDEMKYVLPFLEGSYPIVIEKKLRIDRWKRWFTQKSIAFEVTVGYTNDQGEFVGLCVPHEEKGENSWDQDEDGTFQSHFGAAKRGAYGRDLTSCYEAALYFWQSCMRDRERYGSPTWKPQKYKEKKVDLITENPIS